jgi:hypothetical protein
MAKVGGRGDSYMEIIPGTAPGTLCAAPGDAAWVTALVDTQLTYRIGALPVPMLRSAP